MSLGRISGWLRQIRSWPRPAISLLAWFTSLGLVTWLWRIQTDNHLVEEKAAESSQRDETSSSTILGAGTSSVVYLSNKDKIEKRFKSSSDLLNEKTIYQILGPHPRLVSIHHIGTDIIVMEWMKNGDLARFIQSHPDISQHRKHQWIAQIAECFHLLHRHQISHCDSKLENFLLDEEYKIKICDFASSHNYRDPSDDVAIQPLRYRRAVDDFDEAVFNPADDIFAFGSICYEIVTGRPPYSQLDDEDVKLQFSHGDFPVTGDLCFGGIMRDCWNGIFNSFEAICKAIEKEEVRNEGL